MTTLTIRNINEDVKQRLREIAARNGRSMEEEVRRILSRFVYQESENGLGSAIVAQFSAVGGVELEIPPRSPMRPAPQFGVDDA